MVQAVLVRPPFSPLRILFFADVMVLLQHIQHLAKAVAAAQRSSEGCGSCNRFITMLLMAMLLRFDCTAVRVCGLICMLRRRLLVVPCSR